MSKELALVIDPYFFCTYSALTPISCNASLQFVLALGDGGMAIAFPYNGSTGELCLFLVRVDTS